MEFSQTRDRTGVPYTERRILNHWTTREVLEFIFVYGIMMCSNFIILHVAVQFSQTTYWGNCLFSIVYSCRLCHRLGDSKCVSPGRYFVSVHFMLCSAYIPGEENGNPLQYSCLENPVGYSPWGHKELDTTEWLTPTHRRGRMVHWSFTTYLLNIQNSGEQLIQSVLHHSHRVLKLPWEVAVKCHKTSLGGTWSTQITWGT